MHGFKVGENVYSYSWDNPQGGFYAQYVAVPAERVGHMPMQLTMQQAGAIATTGLTALQGIDNFLKLKSGQSVIIHGASGGVGTLAIQFAKLRGARVLATASGADGFALAKKLGADAVVDARSGTITAAAHDFAPGGVDAVLALVGGDALERCIAALHPGGRVAFPHGVSPPPHSRSGITIAGYNAVASPVEFSHLNAAIAASHLQVYPLAQAAQAQRRVETGHVLGKVILQIE